MSPTKTGKNRPLPRFPRIIANRPPPSALETFDPLPSIHAPQTAGSEPLFRSGVAGDLDEADFGAARGNYSDSTSQAMQGD